MSDKQLFQFEVRDEDGQVMSRHATNADAQDAARQYRRDRERGPACYTVFGPVAETSRQ